MRKSLIFAVILLLLAAGIFSANTYTSAMIEFPISVKNPRGLIHIDPSDLLTIEQGKSETALKITNNLLVYIEYKLVYSHDNLTLLPDSDSGFIAPGEILGVTLDVSDNCPPGDHELSIELLAEFDGGKASIKTTIPVTVLEAPSKPKPKPEAEPEADPEDPVPADAPVVKYTLTLIIVGEGTTNLDADEHLFTEGSAVELTATPADKWCFKYWLIGDQTFQNSTLNVTVNNDVEITAIFAETPVEEPEPEPEPELEPEPEPEPGNGDES